MKYVLLTGLIVFAGFTSAVPSLAQNSDLPALLNTKGFQHFYNLEYDQAIEEFEKSIAKDPSNPDTYNHFAQAIQFRELFRVGALESELVSGNNSFLRRPKIETTPEVEKQFFAAIDKAMSISQARIDKNPEDTKALYALGVAFGLRSNWNFLVKKAWRDSLSDATTGRKMHDKVTELDPSNYDARLVQGTHDYVVGSLPFFYKMLGFLVGFRGDKEGGLKTLQEVAHKGTYNRVDAKVLLCALYRREERWKDAEPLLNELTRRFPRNYLLRFEQAQLYSATGNKEKAMSALQAVSDLKKSGAPGYANLASEKILYQMGNLQFWYRDYDAALTNLQKVTEGLDHVDLNTGVLTWMRIGQIYDLTDRRKQAMRAYQQAIRVAPEAEAAKESQKYLNSPYRRS